MAFSNKHYDVILVNPPAEYVIEEYDHPDYPNISIAYIGNYLEKNGGITPALIDARLARLSFVETVDQIVSLNPSIVGITSFTHSIPMAARIAQELKQKLNDIVVVLGGFHTTFLPERTLHEYPVFDYLVAGEGEVAFLKLIESILAGNPCETMNGVWYNKFGKIVNNNPKADILRDIDEIGEPGWHLFDQDVIKKFCRYLPVITQRGCPFQCNFCSRPYGNKVRKRNNLLVVDEIERNVNQYNVKHIDFYDETFSANKKATKQLCSEIINRGINVSWCCTTHVNTLDNEIVHLMKKAGCVEVRFGVESGNTEIINQMKKGITKKKILEAHELFKEAKITTTAFFILGHPNESLKSLWDTVKFAIRINADKTAIGIMVPYPGSEIWNMVNEGRGGIKISRQNGAIIISN
ncbi:MAG: radical SAM protein [Desulfobacterales bacterium]|nr:radical SAM protein [Desulfobacterales bacterium]